MTDTLLARKGQAVPTGLGSGERYALANATRRVIALGQMADTPAPLAWPEKTPAATFTAPRSAARILPRSRRAAEYRRRFTFRLHDEEHKLFCAAAAVLGCSRQKLLERALNRYLRTFGPDNSLMSASATASASSTQAPGPLMPRLI